MAHKPTSTTILSVHRCNNTRTTSAFARKYTEGDRKDRHVRNVKNDRLSYDLIGNKYFHPWAVYVEVRLWSIASGIVPLGNKKHSALDFLDRLSMIISLLDFGVADVDLTLLSSEVV